MTAQPRRPEELLAQAPPAVQAYLEALEALVAEQGADHGAGGAAAAGLDDLVAAAVERPARHAGAAPGVPAPAGRGGAASARWAARPSGPPSGAGARGAGRSADRRRAGAVP